VIYDYVDGLEPVLAKMADKRHPGTLFLLERLHSTERRLRIDHWVLRLRFYQQSKPGGAAPQGGGVSRGGASGRNHAVEQFTARLEVVPFSLRAAAHFGQIRAELAKLGTLCGACDMLIGAHARSEGLMLVTNNVGEFQRIPGLLVDNWV
jgi:hypothetical protein